MAGVDVAAFDSLKWADYRKTAKPDEAREVLRRCLTLDENKQLLQ